MARKPVTLRKGTPRLQSNTPNHFWAMNGGEKAVRRAFFKKN